MKFNNIHSNFPLTKNKLSGLSYKLYEFYNTIKLIKKQTAQTISKVYKQSLVKKS